MLVSYDPEAGATYVECPGSPVARTVSVSDLVIVDLDERGEPVGVEFAVAPRNITTLMLRRVVDRFPALAIEDARHWLLTSA